jgi:hypothetical protein
MALDAGPQLPPISFGGRDRFSAVREPWIRATAKTGVSSPLAREHTCDPVASGGKSAKKGQACEEQEDSCRLFDRSQGSTNKGVGRVPHPPLHPRFWQGMVDQVHRGWRPRREGVARRLRPRGGCRRRSFRS